MDAGEFTWDIQGWAQDGFHNSAHSWEYMQQLLEICNHTDVCSACKDNLQEQLQNYSEVSDILEDVDFSKKADWMCFQKRNKSLSNYFK